MSILKVNDSIFYDIASAIRSQLGTNRTYKPQSMASAIRQIRVNTNIIPMNVNANGVYTASGSVNGYNPLVVNVPNSYSYADNGKVVIGSSLVSQTDVTVSSNGVYNTSLNKQVTVNVEGGGDITSDATLSSGSQMLSGVTAYARGSKYTGTIPMYNGSINSGQGSVPTYDYYSGSYVLTPSTVDQSFPTAGYIMSQNLQLLSYSGGEPYDGSYVIAPSIFSQAFPTAGKLLSEDLVVEGFDVDFYSGSYEFTPSTEQFFIPTSGKSLVSDIQINAYIPSIDPYEGSYVVTPSWLEQTLETEGKTMLEDLVIEPYPTPDVYDGSYVITPSTVSQSFPTADLLMNDDFVVEAYEAPETYEGSYVATPSAFSQVFPTAGLLMSESFVVEPLEAYEGDYVITPSTVSQSFPTAGKLMSEDLVIEGTGETPTYDADVLTIDIGTIFSSSLVEFRTSEPISKIGEDAFARNQKLISVSFPQCEDLHWFAFFSCPNLTQVSLPLCDFVSANAFENCVKLESIDLPLVDHMMSSAFKGCTSLANVSFPELTNIEVDVFTSCPLTSVYFPKVYTIYPRAFSACTLLSTASFPELYGLWSNAFLDCEALTSLYLASNRVVLLSDSTAFSGTPIWNNDSAYAKIYVPSTLVSSYKADSVWSYFSNCIVPIEEGE